MHTRPALVVVPLLLVAVLATVTSGQTTQPAAPDQPAPRAPSATALDCPEISADGGVVPVRIIDDRVILSCDVSGPRRRIPVNLWLDFDGAYGLQLHNRAAAPLPAETGDGRALPLTLHFPDFTLTVPRRELGDEEAMEAFTKYHSHEMGENALVGALGAHYLKHFSVVLDLPRSRIEIRPQGSLSGRTPGPAGDQVVLPISEHNDLVWLPVTIADGRELALAVATSRYDSVIDRAVCDRLGRPAGDVGEIACGGHDLATYVAFRPEDIVQVHPRGVGGMIGTNLLRSFRIEVDRLTSLATLEPRDDAEFPAADLEFFRALASEDAEAVSTWLETHEGRIPEDKDARDKDDSDEKNHRLGREAAELLLTLRLEETADADQLRDAIKWVNDTMVTDLRATRMLDLMEEMSNEGQLDLVIAAGRIGVESGRKDRYPDAVHKIHGRLGEVMLERDEDRDAWRHLLSAAFGLPDDGMVNLNLGRYYEKAGRFRRAFSRYIQAVIKEDSGPQAMEGLQRIDEQMPETDRLSLDVIERMIAGKVRADTAPVKFEPSDDEPATNRTVLVEFFTNAYVGDERRGAIGGALGNQRLLTHFEPEHAVFLSYHLAAPQPDPLVNPLALHTATMLGVERPVVQVVNGVNQGPGAGRWRDSEAIYDAVRTEIIREMSFASDYRLELEGRLDKGDVAGSVTVEGPESADEIRVQVIVAEKGVLFPGKSTVVVHRHLARGTVFEDLSGVPYDGGDAQTTSFRRALRDIETENEAYLDELEASGAGTVTRMSTAIDPRSVVLVAIVRSIDTGEVLQAAQVELQELQELQKDQEP